MGTNTYLKSGETVGPDLEPNPECGTLELVLSKCYQCYNITEVHEPIFEMQLKEGTTKRPSVCDYLVQRYFIDGVEQGCDPEQGYYHSESTINPYDKASEDRYKQSAYYPYDETLFEKFKEHEPLDDSQDKERFEELQEEIADSDGSVFMETCGNGVCEAYEFNATCEEDCGQLPFHEYRVCEGWGGAVQRVRILGLRLFIEDSGSVGADFKPSDCRDVPTCGQDRYCYTVKEVHEPIFEFQVWQAAKVDRVSNHCNNLALNHTIDGAEVGCSAHDWKVVSGTTGHRLYFPYEANKFKILQDLDTYSVPDSLEPK